MTRSFLAFALLIAALAPAEAQRKKEAAKSGQADTGNYKIADYGDWDVLTSGKDKQKVCFALSKPKERLPKTLTRDPAYFYISNRSGDGARNEVSILMGYPLKPGGASTITVGAASFQMQTKDKTAWLKNAAEEGQLVEAMKKGKDIVVKGTSARGNETTDRYSLTGLAQAVDRAQKECQ